MRECLKNARNCLQYLLGDMIEQLQAVPGHDVVGYGVDLAVHHELLAPCQLHEDDAKVCAAQVEREELAEFGAIGQLAHIRREAFDAGVLGKQKVC